MNPLVVKGGYFSLYCTVRTRRDLREDRCEACGLWQMEVSSSFVVLHGDDTKFRWYLNCTGVVCAVSLAAEAKKMKSAEERRWHCKRQMF